MSIMVTQKYCLQHYNAILSVACLGERRETYLVPDGADNWLDSHHPVAIRRYCNTVTGLGPFSSVVREQTESYLLSS